MRVLITGFEPFGGSTLNPSQEVVQRLASQPPVGIELHPAILPVEHRLGPSELLRAFDLYQPEATICLGEAGGRTCISLERVAVNLVDDLIADNAGEQWIDQPVVPGGPAAYFVTWPVKPMLQAMLAAGVPAELSLSAGAFLCNQVAYTLLHALATHELYNRIPAGFIHLPKLPEQAAAQKLSNPRSSSLATMCLEVQTRGIAAGITALQKGFEPHD